MKFLFEVGQLVLLREPKKYKGNFKILETNLEKDMYHVQEMACAYTATGWFTREEFEELYRARWSKK